MTEDERLYGEKLGERIAKARGETTQVLFAKELGVNKNTLLGYEKGRVVPDLLVIRKICDSRLVNWDWLVHGEGPMLKEDLQKRRSTTLSNVDFESPEDAFDALGMAEGMGLLAKIYGSSDTVYIRAINANLLAFSDAVETKAKMAVMAERVQEQLAQMEVKLNALEREVVRLRHENGELKRELRVRSDRDDPISATG